MNNEENMVARRKNVANNEDRRVKKTKKLLRDCLFEILETKSINKVTVKELTDMADVNRSTFYFYYEDIYDMMEKIQNEIYNVFLRDIVPSDLNFESIDDYITYLLRYINFCKENYSICRFVTRNDCNNQLMDKLKAALKENVPNSKLAFEKTDSKYYLTTFAMGGILETVLEWMDDGMAVPPTELAEFVAKLYFFGGKYIKDSFIN